MNRSLNIAAFFAVAGAATAAHAFANPYEGSDTLYYVTRAALTSAFPAGVYVGGGSGNGQGAMVAKIQQTAPMGRMMDSDGNLCTYGGGSNGSTATSASAVVVGLDAIDILSSTSAGGSASCNGMADNAGTGLAYSGTTGVFSSSNANQNWKWVLSLLYGGVDESLPPGSSPDCNSIARRALVANWRNLFQNGCQNGASACAAAPVNGALWHAYRPGDSSDAASVFASILGLSPLPSVSALHGFGASPYCNALNWDTSAANGGSTGNCTLGAHKQWIGPGGVLDPVAADGTHRRPPPGAWGDAPDPSQGALGADVMPTQMQDNDPIRRTCLGSGATNVHARVGEEVCNIEGTLGLVLPLPDWMYALPSPLTPYPTNSCTGFLFGKPASVFTCAPRGNRHYGQCPDGDALDGGACLVPVDSNNGTSQCVASKSSQPPPVGGGTVGDGRHFNVQIRDGSFTEPTIGYAQYFIGALNRSLDFAGGYYRIHQVETAVGTSAQACQLPDVDNQMGCLTQADPCSIGFAGNGAKTWSSSNNPASSLTPFVTPINVDALRIGQIYPATATVQKLGLSGEYKLSRKLYFATFPGNPTDSGELALLNFERQSSINTPLLNNGFFTLGSQSPAGIDTPFCEDFNEAAICGASSNVNACGAGPVCGNGVKDPYEECDNGTSNGTSGNLCSLTCRCVYDFNETTGTCASNQSICGDGIRDPAKEECDDGLGTSTARRACSSQCQLLDELAVNKPQSNGVNAPRSLAVGRHPLAANDTTFAVAYREPNSAPPALLLATFNAVGAATGITNLFSVQSSVVDQSSPVLAGLPGNLYAAAWADFGGDGDELGVAVRLVNPSTPATTAPAFANMTTAFSQYDPDILWTGSQLLVAWADDSNAATAPDLKFRTFDASLNPLSGEQTLASTGDSEGDVALALFNGSWAAAWRDDASGMESVGVQTAGGTQWSVGPFLPPAATAKPALAQLDATHLVLVYAVGLELGDSGVANGSQIRVAVLATGSPGVASGTAVTPLVAAAAGLDQSQPNVVTVQGSVYLSWWTAGAIADLNGEQLWLKLLGWNGTSLDLTQTEVTLPRWPQANLGDQRYPALAANTLAEGGAIVAGWDDLGQRLVASEGQGDVVVEMVPVPVLRVAGSGGP